MIALCFDDKVHARSFSANLIPILAISPSLGPGRTLRCVGLLVPGAANTLRAGSCRESVHAKLCADREKCAGPPSPRRFRCIVGHLKAAGRVRPYLAIRCCDACHKCPTTNAGLRNRISVARGTTKCVCQNRFVAETHSPALSPGAWLGWSRCFARRVRRVVLADRCRDDCGHDV